MKVDKLVASIEEIKLAYTEGGVNAVSNILGRSNQLRNQKTVGAVPESGNTPSPRARVMS